MEWERQFRRKHSREARSAGKRRRRKRAKQRPPQRRKRGRRKRNRSCVRQPALRRQTPTKRRPKCARETPVVSVERGLRRADVHRAVIEDLFGLGPQLLHSACTGGLHARRQLTHSSVSPAIATSAPAKKTPAIEYTSDFPNSCIVGSFPSAGTFRHTPTMLRATIPSAIRTSSSGAG